MSILVTGAAGFIGFNLSKRLLEKDIPVIGFDNLNSYYDQSLKRSRLGELIKTSSEQKTEFSFFEEDLENLIAVENAFLAKDITGSNLKISKPKVVIHLAAQAGVRYSIINPNAYIQANIVGFLNILEACKKNEIKHLIYASSSSVYGGNTNLPFKETQNVDHPVSIYAATKKANELMAHSYSHLYNLPTTGLRFFTVYGPWGRPDMALFKFTKAILENKQLEVYNHGKMKRDFTYIDDVVESIVRLIEKAPEVNLAFNKNNPNPAKSWAPYQVFNIGNSQPTDLLKYIDAIENSLNMKASLSMLDMQPGDVPETAADTLCLEDLINFKPMTSIEEGIKNFVKWYREYYNV